MVVEDLRWFKTTFGEAIVRATRELPFGIDLLSALAMQETGLLWSALRRQPDLSTTQLLRLCVGDTIDARKAFPRSKAELLAAPQGERMFALARAALVEMAQYLPAYRKVAAKPAKFCHGFGIFQRDIQHFLRDPEYFLAQRYADFDIALEHTLTLLTDAQRRLGWREKTQLSEHEQAALAIVYNCGRYKPAKGLQQGWFDGEAYYGQRVFDYLRLARTVTADALPPSLPVAAPHQAVVKPPSPLLARGARYVVSTREGMLRLRREPVVDAERPEANVVARLPAGQLVSATGERAINHFLAVETTLFGALYRGYASQQFLRKATPAEIADTSKPPQHPALPIAELKANRPITRADLPGPCSLNEVGQPARRGHTPAELRAALGQIIDWLDVAKPAHRRYAPQQGRRYAAVYAHDYCHLAGAYLPRVWWTPAAIERLAQARAVPPRYGDTVTELAVNDLFRWLRDFGQRYGWRQTSSLSTLQQEVNQGALGLLIARGAGDGSAGQLTLVVPEILDFRARRSAEGEVIAPVESGAGTRNFRYRVSRSRWWQNPVYAEWAYWLHA